MKSLIAAMLVLSVASVSEAGGNGRSNFRFRSNFRGGHSASFHHNANFVAPIIVPAPIYAQPQAFIGGYSQQFNAGGCSNGAGAGVLQFNTGGGSCSALFRAGY